VNIPELALTVSSRSLTFDEQPIATTSTPEQLTLTNTSTGPVAVVEIMIGGDDFVETDNCFASTPLPVGASCTILVSFKPTEAGHRIGLIRIYNSKITSSDDVRLSGTGVRR
jgi:hypothetical protein